MCLSFLQCEVFMKYYFVINSHAGKGNKVNELIQNINSVCTERGVDFEIYLTQSVGDAEIFIKRTCAKYENSDVVCRFFACGGDGTVNECLNGIIDYPQHELAVIPIGTGNDFVRSSPTGEGHPVVRTDDEGKFMIGVCFF